MRRNGIALALSLAGWAVVYTACSGESSSSGGATAATPEPRPPAVQPPGACSSPSAGQTDSITDPSFELRASTTGAYAPGVAGSFGVLLAAQGGYHVNQDYPIQITLRGPAEVGLARTELGREQAAEFGEPRARFDVPFTATAAGQHRVLADVDFAVCTEENCMPDCRTIALVLPVEAGAAGGEAPGATATP
jgi:hypothetical protein